MFFLRPINEGNICFKRSFEVKDLKKKFEAKQGKSIKEILCEVRQRGFKRTT